MDFCNTNDSPHEMLDRSRQVVEFLFHAVANGAAENMTEDAMDGLGFVLFALADTLKKAGKSRL
jgi:hypothetical protein